MRTNSPGHVLFVCWILILFVSLSSLTNNIVLSATTNPTSSVVLGTIIDAKTLNAIDGASIVASRTISVGTGRTVTYQTIVYSTETETNGSYRLVVDGGFNYQFCVYSDNPSTLGYDYVPKLQNIQVEPGKETISDFNLIEAASVILSGDMILVNSSLPLSTWTLTVVPHEMFPGDDSNICSSYFLPRPNR